MRLVRSSAFALRSGFRFGGRWVVPFCKMVGLCCETPMAFWGDCCLMEGGVMPLHSMFVGSPGNAKLQLGHLLAELGLSVPRELWSQVVAGGSVRRTYGGS